MCEETSAELSLKETPDTNITKITVHYCDKLKLGYLLTQPVVYMHIINSDQGSYVKKQDKDKAAVSFYETQRGDIDYIMPFMTHPCSIFGETSQVLKWDESFILNENLEYLLRKEFGTILFFEIVNLVPMSSTKDNYERLNENGKKKLAWAFIKLVGANDVINTGEKLRLQLYKVFPSRKKKKTTELEVFHWWRKKSKIPLQSSLYISIIPHKASSVKPALRSMQPLQEEVALPSSEKLGDTSNKCMNHSEDFNNSASTSDRNSVEWSRKEGEPCKIPTKNSLTLSNTNCCFMLKFSSLGRLLVIGSGFSNQYFISFYEIPSGKLLQKKFAHSGVIYDFDWCKDDSFLLTASGDYNVKLWSTFSWELQATFAHPSFVYAAKFCPSRKDILFTACYDHVIRIWTFTKNVQLLQELEGHNSSVNTLCWLKREIKLISGDSNGQINIWNALSVSKYSSNQGNFEHYSLRKELNLQEIKGISVDKILHCNSNDELLLFCGDATIRLIHLSNGEILFRYKPLIKPLTMLTGCCSPCGNLFFLCNPDGSISVWDIKSNQISGIVPNTLHSCQLSCIDYHPFEHMIAVSSLEETVPIFIYSYDEANSCDFVSNLSKSKISKQNSIWEMSDLQTSRTYHENELLVQSEESETNNLPAELKMYSSSKINEKQSNRKKQYTSHLTSHEYKSDKDLYESDSPISRKSLESFENSEKSETLTAVITQSGQFKVVTVTEQSLKSDGSGSQSSSNDLPKLQKRSKRSERRRKLKESQSPSSDPSPVPRSSYKSEKMQKEFKDNQSSSSDLQPMPGSSKRAERRKKLEELNKG